MGGGRGAAKRGTPPGPFLTNSAGEGSQHPATKKKEYWLIPPPPPALHVEVDERGGPGVREKAAGWLPASCWSRPSAPPPSLGRGGTALVLSKTLDPMHRMDLNGKN